MSEEDRGKILKFRPLEKNEKHNNNVNVENFDDDCQSRKFLRRSENMVFDALRKGAIDQAITVNEMLVSFNYQLNPGRLAEALSIGYVKLVRRYIGEAISSVLCEECTVSQNNCITCKGIVDNIYFIKIPYYIKALKVMKRPIPLINEEIIEVLKEEKERLSLIRMQEEIKENMDGNSSETFLSRAIIETILTGEVKHLE